MNEGPRYGLVLPHFGRDAERDRLLGGARRIERYGFDAVFVRDHLSFRPRAMDEQDRNFLEPFVVLSAVAAVTERLVLGTAVLVPHRHPIHAAMLLGSLERLAGPGRVLPFWGIGGHDREFAAIGMGDRDRRELLRENIEIIRTLWSGRAIDHEGRFFRFRDIDVLPGPAGGRMPMWYGGTSVPAVRRAAQLFDGWSSGNMPARDFVRLRTILRELCEAAGRPLLPTAITVLVSPGPSVEAASRHVPLEGLAATYRGNGFRPPEGGYAEVADLDGAVLAGPAEVIAQGVRRHQANGADLVILDLRLRFADWDRSLATLGEEVLPMLRRADGPRPASAERTDVGSAGA